MTTKQIPCVEEFASFMSCLYELDNKRLAGTVRTADYMKLGDAWTKYMSKL
ncbi:MAG: hypothetical protein JST16_04815 [Bdellovibrionales bacterium]|nr:hypothetical protein [Bdellovibrionales bacterium]